VPVFLRRVKAMGYDPNDLVTIKEFEWTKDFSYQRKLTCINHQECMWGTKNPFERSVHYYSLAVEECKCPDSDLRVVVSQSQNPWDI
jgi:hypothetical protein